MTGPTPEVAAASCTAYECGHYRSHRHCSGSRCGNGELNCLACLREALAAEKRRSAALLVDADKRERRALDRLPDCDAHRSEIQYLRHAASWYWDAAQNAEVARSAIVGELIIAARKLECRKDAIPAAEVAGVLDSATAAQKKHLGKHGYPTFADCQRGGGCDHDGLSDSLKAEIAGALGLLPRRETAEAVLF